MTLPTRDLLRLAWPASLATVVHSFYRLNDQFFVAGLGVEAQAAVAVGSMVVIWLFAFAQLGAVGTLAVAARRLGEGDAQRAHATMRTGMVTAAATGTLLAAGTLATLPWLSGALVRGEHVDLERALLQDYLFWIAIGQVVLVVAPCLDSCFLALKDARTPLVLQLLSVSSNALLNSRLVPELGVAGAGLASVLSRLAPLCIGLYLLSARGVALRGRVEPALARRILRIGAPSCAAIAIYSAVYQVMLAVTFSHFDALGRTTLGIGFGIESIFFCLHWGVATAVASLVGRLLGEGAPGPAIALVRTAARLNLLLGVLTAGIFWTAGRQLVGLFSADEATAETNAAYLTVLAWAQPLQAMEVVFENALIGAGLTLPVMVATSSMNALRIPLAHVMAVVAGLGLPGIWWAINLSSAGKCLWAWILYARGRWTTHQV